MSDLEITKLCAAAMGLECHIDQHNRVAAWVEVEYQPGYPYRYDPLHEDAQAMALVKRLRLACGNDEQNWYVRGDSGDEVENADLRRAICLCVAQMQAAKVTA